MTCSRPAVGFGSQGLSPHRVMPALVAGIYVFVSGRKKDVDGRNKSGHDDLFILPTITRYFLLAPFRKAELSEFWRLNDYCTVVRHVFAKNELKISRNSPFSGGNKCQKIFAFRPTRQLLFQFHNKGQIGRVSF